MQYDVFISYAHNDNMAPKGQYGWVDNFHIALYNYLTERLGLGRKAKIWRDRTELQGNDLLNEALSKSVSNSLIYIPIISSNFLASEYCLEELKTFCTQSNVFQGVKTRIFPVVKLPFDKPLPPPLNEILLKFAFYNEDDFGDLSEELNPAFGDEFRNKFNQRVNDLAREVAAFIGKNPNPAQNPPVALASLLHGNEPVQESTLQIDNLPPTPPANVQKIYLAEPSPDLFENYLSIKRDLEERRKHGQLKFEFLPHPLPEDLKQIPVKPYEAEDYKQLVRNDTEQSRLTIHLIGKKHTGVPSDSDQSYLDLAMEVAAERDDDTNFNRLVWIPKNIFSDKESQEKGSEQHKAFISKIRHSGVGGDGLMQDSFENFKTRIVELLGNEKEEEKKDEKSNEDEDEDDTRWIYVLYDKVDLESALIIEKIIEEKGYPYFAAREYLDPDMRGGMEIDLVKAHDEYLSICDAVLIYWNKAPFTWIKKNISDFPRIKSVRKQLKKGPFRAQAVFCEGNLEGNLKAHAAFRSPPPPNILKLENYSNLPKFFEKLK